MTLRDRLEIAIRAMRADDADEVHDVVRAAFDACVAPDYGADGVRHFRAYASRNALRQRLGDHLTLLAQSGPSIVGVCQFRERSTLSMLFVRPDRHRRGVARRLVDAGLAACRAANPRLDAIHVASSPYAVDAYRALGFVAVGELADQGGGIVAMPMVLKL